MVAVIKTSSSLRNVLNYNENKLKQNYAELIHSNNYAKDTDQLTFTDKIRTIEKNNELNQTTKLKTVHISLNFDPSEKLDKETLQQIADAYMQQIGFGEQPYLVYQHYDAGHPHMHIVSTNIKSDGSGIKMFNIGRNQSEQARRQIEQDFKLVHASRNELTQPFEIKALNAQKINYGKTETKRAITNVLDAILPTYKYASLPELNAVLRQYNIMADRGGKDSRIYKNNGIVYRVLNEKGEKVGTPIKASVIYSKPGLKFLEEKFAANQRLKQPHKLRVKNAIDYTVLHRPVSSLDSFINALIKEKIDLVLRQNDQGIVYGLTYIDHQTKCVFNGSDIGKEYSANAILKRFTHEERQTPRQAQLHDEPAVEKMIARDRLVTTNDNDPGGKIRLLKELLTELTRSENEGALNYELRQEQTKKRRRKLRQ